MAEWAKASKLLNAIPSSESDSDSERELRKSKRLKVNCPNWVCVNDNVKGCSLCNKRTIHPKKKGFLKENHTGIVKMILDLFVNVEKLLA